MNNLIFYFSGTGNSLQVAQDIAAQLGDCAVLPMTRFDTSQEVAAERVGLVFPVYFWGLPLAVVRFIEQLKVTGDSYFFAAATYGVWPGKALEQAGALLKGKGRALDYGFLVRMPDNYILWYGAKSEKVQRRLFAKEKVKVQTASAVIAQKQQKGIEKSHYVIDRLLTDAVYVPKSAKLAQMDHNFSTEADCTGCGLCVRQCPVDNIRLVQGRPQWQHRCEVCLSCIQRCPTQAINYGGKTAHRTRYVNPNVRLTSGAADR